MMIDLIPIETVLPHVVHLKLFTDTDMKNIPAVIQALKEKGARTDKAVEWLSEKKNHKAYRDFIKKGIVAIDDRGVVKMAFDFQRVRDTDIQCDDCGNWLNGLIGEHIHIDVAALTQEQIEATGITETKNVCGECFRYYKLNFDDFHHGC